MAVVSDKMWNMLHTFSKGFAEAQNNYADQTYVNTTSSVFLYVFLVGFS